MKKALFFLSGILALLGVVSACNQAEQEQDPAKAVAEKVYPVHFVAGEIETRTQFGAAEESDGTTTFPTLWTDYDSQIAVSLNLNPAKGATVNPAQDYKSATFDADFSQSEVSAPYTFYALSPYSAYVGASSSRRGYHFSIPADQTPLASSCDEDAQIMVASQAVTSIEDFSHVDLHFSHVTAYGRMTLKNMNFPEGAQIVSIDLTASTPFVGQYYYDFENDALEQDAPSRTVSIRPDHITIDAGTSSDIWFACAPADLGDGTFKVDVNTTAGVLSRTVSVGAGKLAFQSGHISKFGVNMADAVFTPAADRWVLVTDASTLAAGDEIIIASSATAGAAYALSTTQKDNYRERTPVSIAQDADGQTVIQGPGVSVEVLTLVAGAYTGYFYLQETTSTTGRYLGASNSTSNYLHSNVASTATNNDNKGYYNWSFSIANKIAYITTYSTVKKNGTKYKHLRHNDQSPRFSAYLSSKRNSWDGGTGSQSVYVYRKEAGVHVEDDPILQQEAFGAYLSGGNRVAGVGDQLSREYLGDGTVTFAILSPATYTVAEFGGIPISPAKGETFTLTYNLITGRSQDEVDYDVTVVKVDGPKVWLSTGGGQGFIVKK